MHKVKYSNLKEIFKSLNICIDANGRERFGLETIISFPNVFRIEENSTILSGSSLTNIGFMSYSWSPLVDYVSLGRYVSIAGGLKFSGVRHPIEAVTTSPIMYDKNFSLVKACINEHGFMMPSFYNRQPKREIIIGNDVWIGSNVWLARGITIGTGAVLAAESVVTKDVPPYAIMGGNPAKLIRYRFAEAIIQALLKSEWWEFPPSELAKLDLSNPENFINDLQYITLDKFEPRFFSNDKLPKEFLI